MAANQFRMTQSRDQQQAIRTHEQVGKEVRDAITRIGGDLPENIPPAEYIKEVESADQGRDAEAANWISEMRAACWAMPAKRKWMSEAAP